MEKKEMKVAAVIPIKLNNERLPGKNTKELANGKPLISCILDTLANISEITSTQVFCSDPSIQEYLVGNAEFLQRDPKLDLASSNFSEIFESFRKETDADVYVYAHATAPFLQEETIRTCIRKVCEEGYDSAFTATRHQDFAWFEGKSLNYDVTRIPRTQDISPVYIETSGVYVFRKEVFATHHSRIGQNPYICEVSQKEAVDINYPEDFEMANFWIQLEEQK